MESEFHVDPVRVDPNRWSLVRLIPIALVAIALAWSEYLLLQGIHGGWRGEFWQAVLFGALLIFCIWILIVAVRDWWRRPVGDQALAFAAGNLAQLLGAAPAVFCREKQILTFDPVRKIVIFENFAFATSFMRNPPRVREEVPFEEVVDCTFYPGAKGGPSQLTVTTTHGPTSFNERMEGFDAARVLVESIVTLNLANPAQHKVNLRKVPKIQIPWYGWLIILLIFAGLAGFIWLLTKI